jgi:hypothetical protein
MKTLLNVSTVFLLLFCLQYSKADEGMWMPHQIEDLQMENSGLLISPQEIYKTDGTGLMNAIVSFGGGTGSFVSKEGLILTNHHVAFGALQRASDATNDYIKNGFLAISRNEELPAHGLYIDILLSYEDITEQIYKDFQNNMSDELKYKYLERRSKEIIAEVEQQEPQTRVKIAKTFGGRNYYLYRFKRLRDIRIVYAPPIDLGKFGGEIDNWIWPRHTADFTFFRAYVSPDGKGEEYHQDNIPYNPQSYLKISLKGFREKDFSFVMGYPGKTYRNDMLAEFLYSADRMRQRKDKYQHLIDFYETATLGNRAVEIKYASKIKSLHNTVKNYKGKLEGFEKENIYQKKTDLDKEIRVWASHSELKESMNVFNEMEKLIQQKKNLQLKMDLLSDWISSYSGPNILYISHYIYRTVYEREKPDMERDAKFQERNFPYIKNRIKMAEHNFDLEIDQQFYVHSLKKLSSMATDQLPNSLKRQINSIGEMSISDYVKDLYRESELSEPEKRIELLQMSLTELEALDDPFISIAKDIESDLIKLREEQKLLIFRQSELTKIYSEMLIMKNNNRIAPDANSTIRLTFGTIEGYSPDDGIYYLPQTTLKGIIAKDTGEYPFNVPAKLRELHEQKDFGIYADSDLKDVPACFLNTTNVTGGNSGSPTLNAAGEIIGLIFDMTYESIIGDYFIISDLQRTISVDIRYILFITEKYSNAGHIIREIEL